MPGWAGRRRVVVRFDPNYVGGDEDEDWVSPVDSRHADLQRVLPVDDESWSAVVLRRVLHNVQVGNVLQQVAVLDAWLPDESSLCVVYWPPFAKSAVGLRRVEGDRNPDPTPFVGDKVRAGIEAMFNRQPESRDEWLVPPRDASAFADDLVLTMSTGLGDFSDHLRYDSNGLGWWGTLGDSLPVRP